MAKDDNVKGEEEKKTERKVERIQNYRQEYPFQIGTYGDTLTLFRFENGLEKIAYVRLGFNDDDIKVLDKGERPFIGTYVNKNGIDLRGFIEDYLEYGWKGFQKEILSGV